MSMNVIETGTNPNYLLCVGHVDLVYCFLMIILQRNKPGINLNQIFSTNKTNNSLIRQHDIENQIDNEITQLIILSLNNVNNKKECTEHSYSEWSL